MIVKMQDRIFVNLKYLSATALNFLLMKKELKL